LLLLITALIGCNNGNRMNETERNLIESGDYNTPFRVLTIDNADDLKVLRTVCTNLNYERDSALIKKMAARMLATMIAENGVGIAAPQIGISRNIFLFMRINHPNHPVEIAINPRIINKPNETICFEGDGCLSIPGQSGNTARYAWVEVEYLNIEGETIRERLEGFSRTDDFTGIIFQHEYDHLKGILYTDRVIENEDGEI
jgi:peptide deformylase